MTEFGVSNGPGGMCLALRQALTLFKYDLTYFGKAIKFRKSIIVRQMATKVKKNS